MNPLLRRLAVLAACVPACAGAATFVVDTTSSVNLASCTAAPGDCSLPGAVNAAGSAAGADTIVFDIPLSDPGCTAATGVCRITLNSGLPDISQPLTVDGYTQPGAVPNTLPAPGANNAQLKVEVASLLGELEPIKVLNTRLTLRGLAVFIPSNRMISVQGASSVVLQGNWIGITAAGSTPEYTTRTGALGLSGPLERVVIGGPFPADRNVLAGSGRDVEGLSGGGGNELRVDGGATQGTLLFEGNLVGLAPDGITPLPFRDPLVVRSGTPGLPTPDMRILGNRFARPVRNFGGGFGGALKFENTRLVEAPLRVQGNVFGLGVDGSRPGVEGEAIDIVVASSLPARFLIGGTAPGEGNVFAATTATGTATGSAIRLPRDAALTRLESVGNRMLGNDGLGLDIPTFAQGGGSRYGHTPNDPGDDDTGTNGLLNHPDIESIQLDGPSVNVIYRVDTATTSATYPLRVDFYRALGDEGEAYLDSDVYAAEDALLPRSAVLDIPTDVSLVPGDVLVAVATDAEGRSSEFSFDPIALSLAGIPDPQPAGAPFAVEVSATALEGPFRPNGVVEVTLQGAAPLVCRIELQPQAAAGTSGGSCVIAAPAEGEYTLTATYRATRGAFAGADGLDVTATTGLTVTAPGPEQVGFTLCRQRVVEGEVARVLVTRISGGAVAVGVNFTHVTGTATPGEDYTPPPDQMLFWPAGDFAPKSFDIPIAADTSVEPSERFRLILAQPSGTAILPFALLDVEIMDGLGDGLLVDGFETTPCLP